MKASTLLTLTVATFALAAPTPEINDDVSKRQYGSYGSYPAPAGGYGSYGSYDGSTPPPGQYGSYPPPAGGYGSYGTYKRAVDWVKSFFN
jgi:hypothetical protein